MHNKLFLVIIFLSLFLSAQAKLGGEIHFCKTWLNNVQGGGFLQSENAFGEYKLDAINSALAVITCYRSKDLMHCGYRGAALPISDQKDSDIGKGCILYSQKVIFNITIGPPVMTWMDS
jgi:hypothetical protein